MGEPRPDPQGPTDEERIDPLTGEIIPAGAPSRNGPTVGFTDLPSATPSLPEQMTGQPQPMRPDTAAALAQAGYELQVAGPAGTDGAQPSGEPGTGDDGSSAATTPATAPPQPDKGLPAGDEASWETGTAPYEEPEEAAAVSAPARLIKVLLARETLPHFGVLALFMLIFLVLTFRKDEGSGDWLIALGLGGPLAYLITALLVLTPLTRFIRHPRFGWALPLVLGLVLAVVLRHFLLDGSENADTNREFLELGLAGLFVVWQFLQAWWMRVPFENWAAKRFEKGSGDDEFEDGEADDWGTGPVAAVDKWATRLAGKGTVLNALAPIFWALIGLGLFQALYQAGIFAPEEGARFQTYDTTFQAVWLATMVLVGLLLTLLVRRMLRWAPDSGRVALFSGAFAFGFWIFLAYHAFALFWSLAQAPSFAFDLLFMLITIVVAIYSLSSKALRNARGLVRPENVLFFGILFGISYSAANFFLISDFSGFGGGFEPRTVGQLSHLVAAVFGAVVLLHVNVGFLHREGHLHHGGLSGLLKALSKPYPPLPEAAGNGAPAPEGPEPEPTRCEPSSTPTAPANDGTHDQD